MNLESAFAFFGVSALEAKLYVSLLQRGAVNGSELAKFENLTRASVYSALQNLAEKGLVRIIPGNPQRFEATPYKQVMRAFEQRSSDCLQELGQTLATLPEASSTSHVVNLSDRARFDAELIAQLEQAKHEVYLSCCRNLSFLEPTLKALVRRKVRLVGFTFAENQSSSRSHQLEKLAHGESIPGLCGLKIFPGAELYVRPSVPTAHNASERVMAVVDMKYALSGGFSGRGTFLGIASANTLFVNIIAEHIHHDIYLAKMEKTTGKNPVSEAILINSMHEKGQ